MSASESSPFPLVGLQAVANAHNEWVAVTLQLPQGIDDAPALTRLFAANAGDLFAALAPLPCIIPVADPRVLSVAVLSALPARHTILCVPLALAGERQVQQRCLELSDDGYRIMLDGSAGPDALKMGAQALNIDSRGALPSMHQLLSLPGPHLACHVDSAQRLLACRDAGFSWFAGDYALDAARSSAKPDDGTSRKRLLTLLALLARDADSDELEVLLKQDPALSYHLLKLANSAAFALSTPITNFGQAINMLGRRQLQRWLQLLLYARHQNDGSHNALLPLAAVRGAHMESLCKLQGGDRDRQDLAFMAGVFSLLDVLLGMPMDEILDALNLDPEVALALKERGGQLGALLVLAESGQTSPPAQEALDRAGVDSATCWLGLLQAYQWAIQVSRNL